ncbi:serine/threonine-protein phosphatase 7 long form-like protein [Cucumis melo var. makuwa]|uniref:Serine/threonine-protein phosphatase 7 long form-like protein n=1 Tax=Cucumis melo var. makuwa TaxID=1194695 RepID=A0A5A7UJL0_CUCMM|nr:serine/threonine-protein phosphatase 7 long form-like protein [Cucumis melo var. makuwa]TYK00820.1 serine/threonine-protein phosphatase 7 long form-like protein [Cucumis melo var. makuwa]
MCTTCREVVYWVFDYYVSRALETRDTHISHALWGVHNHAAGCCSAVGEPLTGSLRYNWKFQELPPDADIMNWTPYTPDIMASLPLRCHSGQAVWTYVGQLICFHLVEKYQPDRMLRQFNMLQMPPVISYIDPSLHQIDLRGKHDHDWRRIRAEHIGM